MYTFYLIAVWLHILAAIIWIGGMAFLGMVLAPYARRPEQRDIAISMIRWTGMRFRSIGWVCIGLLILTGLFSVSYRGYGWQDLSSPFWQSSFGHTLGLKFSLLAVILLLSLLHDFIIGPRAGAISQTNPSSSQARRLRRQAAWIGRVNLLLAVVVVALAVILVRGRP
ncbi:MAG: DUF4149 domain-containing protein [Acidobacteria bacterium]|nr:DUF4149 domain-containing protein [Acidobacteriota bacterium]